MWIECANNSVVRVILGYVSNTKGILFMQKLIFLAAIAVSAPLSAQQPANLATIPQIVATARGEVKVVPDRANIQISVQTRGETAAAAGADNAKKQKAVIDGLRALGID